MEPLAWLMSRSGPNIGQQYALTGEQVILGRSSQCDIVLTDEGASRRHARILNREGMWTIEDLGSINGTLVNGQRIKPRVPCTIFPGDEVQIADTVLSFERVREQVEAEKDDQPYSMEAEPAHQRRLNPLLLGMIVLAAVLVLVVGVLLVALTTSSRPEEGRALPVPPPTAQAQNTLSSGEILELLKELEGRLFSAGEMLLKFEPRVSEDEIGSFLAEQGLSTRDSIPALGLWRVTVDQGSAAPLLVDLVGHQLLSYAEPNALAQLWSEPNDPHWSRQWNMRAIKAPEGWDLSARLGNEEVTIAIIDSGIDLSHPDLREKIVPGYDFIEGDADPQDRNGHGTHVAGIAAAIGNNGEGVVGVSWGAKLMPVRVADEDGNCTVFDVAAGIVWATDHGARVLNISLGFPLIAILMDQGLMGADALREAVDYAHDRDVLIVVSSGNEYEELALPGYPAAYAHIIAVGAVNAKNQHAHYSSAGNYVDVVAPGGEIRSLHDANGVFSTMPAYQVALTEMGFFNGYDSLQGTSMAAPHVAGLAALIWSVNPELSNSQVAAIIESSARDLGPRGRDGCFGAGLIDVQRAVELATSGKMPSTGPHEHGWAMSALCEAFTLLPETTFAVPIPTLDWDWENWNW